MVLVRNKSGMAVWLVVAVVIGLVAWQSARSYPAPVTQVHVTIPPATAPAVLNNHPDTLPPSQRVPQWVQIDTPAGYGPVMRACLGVDGVYVGEQGSVTVVPHDPECLTPDPPAKK